MRQRAETAWESYGGKPHGTMTVNNDGRWHRLDSTPDADPVTGVVTHACYLNPSPRWKPGRRTGAILVRWHRVNDPDGAAGAQAYPVVRGMGAKPYIQFNHSEAGRRGVGGYIEIQVVGGLRAVVLSTRYAKTLGVGS